MLGIAFFCFFLPSPYLAGFWALLLPPFFNSSCSRNSLFSSFTFYRSSRRLASSSISYGVLILYCFKKKFTIVERIAESHKRQATLVFAPLGKGELSLYYAETLKD
jgi:hypothetical protein